MGRKQSEQNSTLYNRLILLLVFFASCGLVYVFLSAVLTNTRTYSVSKFGSSLALDGEGGGSAAAAENSRGCCRGINNLELWGTAVKWGSEFKFNSSEGCCNACKSMCSGNDGPCLCDTWVFCGNREACGSKFGECWLKKQKDSLAPERQDGLHPGEVISWTSGLIFGKGEAAFGPPYALIQGTLEAQGTTFNKLPMEDCPIIKRGSVAWIGTGPEFFISLANHAEWKHEYAVFGSVLPEDMHIAEKIATLPTTPDVWNNVNVTVLVKPVPLLLKRFKKSHDV